MYLLDTSVVLACILNPKRLGPKIRRLFQDSSEIHFSAVSIAEIFVKQLLGKLKLQSPLVKIADGFGFSPISFDLEMATELATLGTMIGLDPFDRMITATAKSLGANLITSDRQLLSLGFDWVLDSYN
jgi:PIN domain nuclease of toxin-antitoxin system